MSSKKNIVTATTIVAKINAFLHTEKYLVADETVATTDKTWGEVSALIRKDRSGKDLAQKLLFIDENIVADVLDELDLNYLEDNGFAVEDQVGDGIRSRVRLNGTRRFVVGIQWDALLKAAKAEAVEQGQTRVLGKQTKILEQQVRALNEQVAEADVLRNFANELKVSLEAYTPEQRAGLFNFEKKVTSGCAGVPTLFLSDLHWDEVVDPKQIQFMNQYNREIAQKRLRRVFQSAGDLMFNHTSGAFDGLVIPLGGDMTSGNIHDELRRTNEGTMIEAVLNLAHEIGAGIRSLAAEFPFVYVPCVVGNHGRMDHKPTAKDKALDNFDSFLYVIIKSQLADLPNVVVDISAGADMTYSIYGTKYLLTHGDQAKGGGGVGGISPGLQKLDLRKRKRSIQTGQQGYDWLIIGHWHQYQITNGIVINGSLKGYDEWVASMNFDFEVPQQAMWMTHPEYGMTIRMPVFAESPKVKQDYNHVVGLGQFGRIHLDGTVRPEFKIG